MYVGLLFVLAAWAVWLCKPLAFLFLQGICNVHEQVPDPSEERALSAEFGSEFNAYIQRADWKQNQKTDLLEIQTAVFKFEFSYE
jgi:protein-S-isoprenylcysteine O-methyltransferase Ste14